ncbi:MAG: hypothetical protein GY822_10010 [Deltaproteobacteria bacterium]|nr:hypothetical protein [Deltaproteobacteria bacterium]
MAVVVVKCLLVAILWSLGVAWVYNLWLLSWMTTYGLFLRIRSIAEHAGTDASDDVFRHTRTTFAVIGARLSVAPHRVNLHTEHHLLRTVPYINLPKMHALLMKRGAFSEEHLAKGYLEVLKEISAE